MTNDAERVSDIVARLRTDAPELVRHAAYQRRVHGTCPPGDNIFEDAAAHSIAAADIIEAQSKALAEARATAIEECAQIADAVRQKMELGRKGKALNQIDEHVAGVCDSLAQRIRALTPTPENPNG